jgi:hypothetical protein
MEQLIEVHKSDRCTLARILDERLHLVDKVMNKVQEKATEDAN